jgi:hypothetical protein
MPDREGTRLLDPNKSLLSRMRSASKQRVPHLAIEVNNRRAVEEDLWKTARRKLNASSGTLQTIRLVFPNGRVSERTRSDILNP